MNGDDIQPGQPVYSRKMTTHYLGGGVYLIVRPAWAGRWLVERRDGFGFRYLATSDTRAEADALATLAAALSPTYTGGAA